MRISHRLPPRSASLSGLRGIAAITLSLTLVGAVSSRWMKPAITAKEPVVASEFNGSSAGGVTSAITLPVDQSVATNAPAPAFRINQTGAGPNGIFQISSAGSNQTALQGLTTGIGRAGFFQINNPSNGNTAFTVNTNGTGRAGVFQVINSANINSALEVKTNGAGMAGSFQITNPLTTTHVLSAVHSGRGSAGHFEIINTSNARSALEAGTNGTGRAFFAFQQGTGVGALFLTGNMANTQPAVEISTNGTGDALLVSKGPSTFNGDVIVKGNLTKPAGSFRIDHPLDPEHKYLSHSFVESPDMMNVYNGNVTLDSDGRATVHLPEYFEALNRDFRYQLTAIGAPGPDLYIAAGVQGNQFRISGGRAYGLVSWQVTGVRKDTYATEHRIQVEEDKPLQALGAHVAP